LLTQWLDSKGDIAPGTARSYGIHIEVHLKPHLGEVLLDGLRTAHVHAMFAAIAAIAEKADILPAENAARRAVENAMKQARADGDRAVANAAKTKLSEMPPYRRPTGPATRQRILATLRSALSAACSEQLITVNVAKLATLPSGKRPKAKVWTANRVAEWRRTGNKPSAVMVWSAEQTGAFLNHALGHDHSVLFHLIAFTGLRGGEACGLRWVDLDLTTSEMTVTQQIVQLGWDTALTAPKSDAGERIVALDAATATRLKSHRTRKGKQRLAHGSGWIDTGLVFTAPDGSPLHPPGSPVSSNCWSARRTCPRSGCTTCATARPPTPCPQESTSRSSRRCSDTPTPPSPATPTPRWSPNPSTPPPKPSPRSSMPEAPAT
jgi:integrase